jgi:hypothetical protein
MKTYYDNLSDEEHGELCEFVDSLRWPIDLEDYLEYEDREQVRAQGRMEDSE